MSRRLLPTAIAATALVLAACSSGAASAPAPTGPAAGGTLRWGLQADPVCLDPRQGGLTASLTITRSVVDSLTDQDPDTGEVRPWLAASWDVSPDASSFTFHLRDGVTYSDGEPLTADNVKANFDDIVALGGDAALPAQYVTGYESATVVDPRTVRIDFDRPNAQFLQASSSMSLGLLSTASLQHDKGALCAGRYAASGPFTITQFVPQQTVTLTRRTGYGWAPERARHEGDAYLDSIEFTIAAEAGVRSGSLLSGQLDAVGDLPTQSIPQLTPDAFAVVTRTNPGLTGSFFVNTTRPVLSDVRVRQALVKAVNRQEVADTVFDGQVPPSTSVLGASTPGHVDLGAALAFDAAGAGRLLDEAGWAPGPDGIRVKDGAPLAVRATWNPAIGTGKATLELVAQELRAVGVAITIDPITQAQFTPLLNNRDYDLVYNSQIRPDPDVLWGQFSSDSPASRHGAQDPELSAALAHQRTTTDPGQRNPDVATAQELIVERGYSLPVVDSVALVGASTAVHDITWEASSKPVFYDIWLSR